MLMNKKPKDIPKQMILQSFLESLHWEFYIYYQIANKL